jgi:hypothetical protein
LLTLVVAGVSRIMIIESDTVARLDPMVFHAFSCAALKTRGSETFM